MPWWAYAASTIATVGFSSAGIANKPVMVLRKCTVGLAFLEGSRIR